MLRASGNKLFYYTFPKDDTHSYEVDFLLSRGNKLCPIEVKSSGYKTHASLDAFCLKYSDRISQPYLLYTKDFHKDENVLLLPIYDSIAIKFTITVIIEATFSYYILRKLKILGIFG